MIVRKIDSSKLNGPSGETSANDFMETYFSSHETNQQKSNYFCETLDWSWTIIYAVVRFADWNVPGGDETDELSFASDVMGSVFGRGLGRGKEAVGWWAGDGGSVMDKWEMPEPGIKTCEGNWRLSSLPSKSSLRKS